MENFCFYIGLAGWQMSATVLVYVGPHLQYPMPGLPYFHPAHLCTLQITHTGRLFSTLLSPSPCHRHTHTHTWLLSEDGCILYQRQDPGGRQKIHIRGRWSDIVFGLSAREVLKHPCANRYLVDSRWCSSITGTVIKFCSGKFSRPLHFLSSQEM